MGIYSSEFNFSVLSRYSDAIDRYRSDFFIRSDGFELPEVGILKIYEKSNISDDGLDLLISLPICNQEKIIKTILSTLLKNVNIRSQLIIILDSCQDNTKELVLNFLDSYDGTSSIEKVIILESKGDLFEATCENLAISICESKFFLSMQADIYFADSKFISKAIRFFEMHPLLFGISSRALLNKTGNTRSLTYESFRVFRGLINRILSILFHRVWLGIYFASPSYFGDLSAPPRNRLYYSRRQAETVYLGEMIIRGPIIWKTSSLKALDFFNDVRFFLGGDERDICSRGFNKFGYYVGYMPSRCFSNLWTGTSHNPEFRSQETVAQMQRRIELSRKFDFTSSKEFDRKRKLPRKLCIHEPA